MRRAHDLAVKTDVLLEVRCVVTPGGGGDAAVTEAGTRGISLLFFNWVLVTQWVQFVKIHQVLYFLNVLFSEYKLYFN